MREIVALEFVHQGQNFKLVHRFYENTMVCNVEVHATTIQGEEMLCDDDAYHDIFVVGRDFWREQRSLEMNNALQSGS